VSNVVAPSSTSDRLLSFEITGTVYALPIAEVLEVTQAERITCIPTLPRSAAGVMNWHGDALPVVSPRMVLDEGGPVSEGDLVLEHVLVVSDRPDAAARLGLPIDRVIGLVDGVGSGMRGNDLVVERRPVDGRVVCVLDPRRLVARAEQVIEQQAG